MKRIAATAFCVGMTMLSAQGHGECQSPSAHMNPNCSAGPSTTHGSMPSPSAELSLSGTYVVTGKTPEGAEYEGTVVISGDDATGYSVNWTIGEEKYAGTGKLTGESFSVDWGQAEPIVYKVKREPSGGLKLTSRWGAKKRGKEKLVKLPS